MRCHNFKKGRRGLSRFVRTAVLVFITASIAHSVPQPVGQREYDFVYDRIERQELFDTIRFDYQLGPYESQNSHLDFFPFGSRNTLTEKQLQVYAFASEQFRARKEGRGRMYALLRGGFVARPLSRLTVLGQYYLDEFKAHDPGYTGKKWRGFAGDIDQAFAHYATRKFDITFGRFSSFWGVRNSLVLGKNARLDGFGYGVRIGRLMFSYRFGQLGQDSIGSDTTTEWPNRYLAAHRLDFHAGRGIRVGVFESVIFGGPGRSPEFSYLNPIIFYHGAQLNDDVNDNTLVGFDFDWKPRPGLKLYGQLVLDDVQFDHKSQGDEEPAEYALLVGVYTGSKSGKIDGRIEYTRVTNRTYNQISPRNRYVNGRDPIADVAGNDYDLAAVNLSGWISDHVAGNLSIDFKQQGEGKIVAPFDQPWLDIQGNYSEPFPTGTVERTVTLSTGVRGFVNSMVFVDLKGGVGRITNYDHHPGDKRTLAFVDFYLSLYLSKVVGLE